jgi:blue copper oxidase
MIGCRWLVHLHLNFLLCMMKRLFYLMAIVLYSNGIAQNPLLIPDTLNGLNFNLNVQTGTVQFYSGYNTPTYGMNGNFLGPTLFLNKDDTVLLNVTNNLIFETTMHWHGLHVPPELDGGPHQIIMPGTTWSPRFRVMNNAGTYWYHPHGNGSTELQVTKGLAGMIIIRDPVESALTLPRTYGVDDFPLIVQSRCFDNLYQIAGFTHDDTVMMVNGTIDPALQVPAQMVRFRLLNGSVDRSYLFGLSNDANFYQIATDGGLMESPNDTNRLMLSPGERAEIVADLSGLQGQTIYLMSYASEIPNGIMGSADVSMGMATLPGYNANPLNGNDFVVLELNVVAPTASPVTTIPAILSSYTPLLEGTENTTRSFSFSPQNMGPQEMIEGPFTINGASFEMDSINVVTWLNHTEIWELTNTTAVAHPFHVHDVQFYILDRNGLPINNSERGQKDVVLVKPSESVRIITKFEDFHNAAIPYMYHCHLLHHEDEGMMGSFVVLDSATLDIVENTDLGNVLVYPNPATELVNILIDNKNFIGDKLIITTITGQVMLRRTVLNISEKIDISDFADGVYFIHIVSTKGSLIKKLIVR